MRVVEIEAGDAADLRRRVLDNPTPGPADSMAGVRHFGAVGTEEGVVAIVTVHPEETPARPGRRAWRIRGMATDPMVRGRGAGRAVLETAVEAARAAGAEVVWANARDPALGFYERAGFTVEDGGFLGNHDIPHHLVVLDLDRPSPSAGS